MKTLQKFLRVKEMSGYTTGCFLDYTYFKDIYKMIAIGLSKQQALDSDRHAIEQLILVQI